ncbi:hypothetical protein [Streptomyces sp. NPDC090083]|uniref:hypothetical protein n=1 Tax=Streptomyces sp. NPDC090083 TaxID=3365941 RepID=UPI003820DD0C
MVGYADDDGTVGGVAADRCTVVGDAAGRCSSAGWVGSGCAVVGYGAVGCAEVAGAPGEYGAAGGVSGLGEGALRATLRWIVGGSPGTGLAPGSVRRPARSGGAEAPARGLASAGIAVTGAPRGERRRAGGAGVGEPEACEGVAGADVGAPAA